MCKPTATPEDSLSDLLESSLCSLSMPPLPFPHPPDALFSLSLSLSFSSDSHISLPLSIVSLFSNPSDTVWTRYEYYNSVLSLLSTLWLTLLFASLREDQEVDAITAAAAAAAVAIADARFILLLLLPPLSSSSILMCIWGGGK